MNSIRAFLASIALLTLPFRSADAISANPNPIIQEGLPPFYIKGDEHYHWEEDENGYTIIDNPDNQYPNTTRKVYAKIDESGNHLISTGIQFGLSSSSMPVTLSKLRAAGLKKHVRPSDKIRKTKCGDYCNDLFSSSGRSDDGARRKLQNQEERSNRRQLASSEGSLRNLVVLIRFADHMDRILPSPSEYDVLLNGPGGGTTAPTGSVNDVFLTNSYGQFSLHSTVYPWITLSQPEAYYGDNKSGIGNRIFEAIREALSFIDADPTFDISEFNTDYDQGDPYIDAITIIHSGYGAEFGGSDCYGNLESSRIWSHNWFMYDFQWTSADGTVRVSDYHINPGLWGVCGSEISRIGVIAHETLHFLGLPDLYDPQGGTGIGDYCLMANSWGVDGSQRYPPILSAWSKIQLGWIDPLIITEKGDYTLRRSYQFPEVYKIESGYAPNEYLLIENRQPGSFDALLPLGGLAIWHIDENMSVFGIEGYPGQLGWPANNKHYAVALLQADGKYDLEKGNNYGDYGDLFRKDYFFGVDYLFPSESHPALGPFPNTDSYAQGVLSRTNHFISGITITGLQMTFSVLLSSPCQPGEVHFELTLLTDGKGNEVSWSLSETYTNDIVLGGELYDNYSQYTVEKCLPAKCYTFTIDDSGNDGLCCAHSAGGYSVRLNGQKLASGNEFGNQDVTDLKCIGVPPTMTPTRTPTKPTNSPTQQPSAMPSLRPSAIPSLDPSSLPSGICGGRNSLLEITLEGGEFVEGVSWNVNDMFGEALLSEEVGNNVGLYTKEMCLPSDACYTFVIRDSLYYLVSLNDGENRVLYTVKLDGEEIASGSDFGESQTTIFGSACLGDDDICDDTMSLFRLELASAERELSWKLVDDSEQIILSAGPFGECNINSRAICLPREACYEFFIQDEAGCCSYGNELFTVLFTLTDDMIQNYTGSVGGDFTSVFLGTCYGRNFS